MRLDDLRSAVSDVFLGLLAFNLFLYFYKQRNPYFYPFLEDKALFSVALVFILFVLLYLPYQRLLNFFSYTSAHRQAGLNLISFHKLRKIGARTEQYAPIEISQEQFVQIVLLEVFYLLLFLYPAILVLSEFGLFPSDLDSRYLFVSLVFFGLVNLFFRKDAVPSPIVHKNKSLLLLPLVSALIVYFGVMPATLIGVVISLLTAILVAVLIELQTSHGSSV
ncbi:Uncharacterised protein [uncultured archaeon]|nr:Uncharacterised protein [uncultured archaeon]